MTISWSPVEDTFLIENAHRMPYEELSLYLGKTENAIRERSNLLGCSSSSNKSRLVSKVCAYQECRVVYKVKNSDYLKNGKVFCSQWCEDLQSALFYPDKERIEEQIGLGKDFRQISEYFLMPEGALYELYLKYGMIYRPKNIHKVYLFDKNKLNLKEKKMKQNGRFPMAKFRGGYKPYLGVSVRSGWENNVLLWLNKTKVKWDYEPKVFYFDGVKRGAKGYTPDIWLPKEKIWIEVKGYLSSVDKTKIKRFKKYYPEEFKKLHAITKNDKVDSTKFFKEMGVPIYAYYEDISEKFNDLPNWMD